MLNSAVDAYEHGNRVLIIAHSLDYARQVVEQIANTLVKDLVRAGPSFFACDGDYRRTMSFAGWDGACHRLRGTRDVAVFVDHFALEAGHPNPDLWFELSKVDDREWTRVSRLAPLEAAVDPAVHPRAEWHTTAKIICLRAYVGPYEHGCWRIDADEADVIADRLESRGSRRAADFRAAAADVRK
jgi:hypothetical protein